MTTIKTPSILAFEKKLVPSDARFYGTAWGEASQADPTALHLVEKSVRGTLSNRKPKGKLEGANLQRVDSCSLLQGQDTLKVVFTLKVLSGFQNPSSCNDNEFQEALQQKVNDYIARTSCRELALRYATNIANARFLWRNRVGAQNIKVIVSTENKTFSFDALQIGLDFENISQDTAVTELAELIAQALSRQRDFLLLKVEAYSQLGDAQEVYPSEELILDKSSQQEQGKKSKVLYSTDGIAAMHSQKIGNAIRTIDTWYPDYTHSPIAIEVYGTVTTLGRAFRAPNTKEDFYSLFDNYMKGKQLLPEQEHYIMAVLIRGGVFGETSK